MEIINRRITLEPGQAVVVMAKEKPLTEAEKNRQGDVIKEAMSLIKKEWRIIDGLFFGGDQDAEDSEGNLVGKIQPIAVRLVDLQVSPDEMLEAVKATIDSGRDRAMPVNRKEEMAGTIADYFFRIAKEFQEEQIRSQK